MFPAFSTYKNNFQSRRMCRAYLNSRRNGMLTPPLWMDSIENFANRWGMDKLLAKSRLLEGADSGDVDLVSAATTCHPLVHPVEASTADEAQIAWLESQVPEEGRASRPQFRRTTAT